MRHLEHHSCTHYIAGDWVKFCLRYLCNRNSLHQQHANFKLPLVYVPPCIQKKMSAEIHVGFQVIELLVLLCILLPMVMVKQYFGLMPLAQQPLTFPSDTSFLDSFQVMRQASNPSQIPRGSLDIAHQFFVNGLIRLWCSLPALAQLQPTVQMHLFEANRPPSADCSVPENPNLG